MAIHLISDLHLAPDTPELNRLFQTTLESWSGKIDALYILGDLFEYWVGDDDDTASNCATIEVLRAFSRQTPLYIMHGNRDFLLGAQFAEHSGATLLPDPHLLTVGEQRYLLSHGDALCTDDLAYQQFRVVSRQRAWQQAMLARPLAERHAIARMARQDSEANKHNTGINPISDVTDSAVHALLEQYAWPCLIHGHTHRPAQHHVEHNGHQSQRWVITDWHEQQGGYLRLEDGTVSAHPLGGCQA